MEGGKRLPGPTRTEIADHEFGQGTSVLIENEINKRLDLLRKNPFDSYLYTKLEIASQLLLGKPALHESEYVDVVRLKADEWTHRKQNKSLEEPYDSALIALEYYFLTGRDIASKEELKELKKEAETIAEVEYLMIFNDLVDTEDDSIDEDLMGEYGIILQRISKLGLIARYLGLDSIDGKYEQIIKTLETHTKNINIKDLLTHSDDEDSILFMKRMADIILIKDHITKV